VYIYTGKGCGKAVAGPIGRRVTGRGGAGGCTAGSGGGRLSPVVDLK